MRLSIIIPAINEASDASSRVTVYLEVVIVDAVEAGFVKARAQRIL